MITQLKDNFMQIKSIQGPYFDKALGQYRIQWLDDGQRQYKLFPDELAARSFKTTLKGSSVKVAPGGSVQIDVPDADPSTAKFWSEATGSLALALMQSANEGDDEMLDRVSRIARAYAPLATAALKLLDREQLEAKLLELEEQMRENANANKLGARTNSTYTV